MKLHRWFIVVSALGLIGVVGCTHYGNHQPLFPHAPWNKNCGCTTAPRLGAAPVGVAPGQPVPLTPEASATPPPGSTLAPGLGSQPLYQSPAAPLPSAPLPSAPTPSSLEIRGYGPAADSTWHAPITNGGVQLATPEAAPPRESVRLGSPESTTPRSPTISENRSVEPPAAPPASDIRQFVLVYDRVASGLRPTNVEGLDWLKAHGYKAVIYLRRPGDDETTDRAAMERRDLKYLNFEVSPENLREALDQFNLIVSDSNNYPLFVYTRSSMITGSLWYLRFRTVDRMTDDAARVKAASLGLEEVQTDANRPMWLAIQKVLEQVR